ncbi:MAG: TylF/MycF/NovP-related O-methyltransferase [Marinoscillum sp.]|uniref:TylF/MycF/NovP-related O-methyltransferase n=1 Tax=Marinoscillum sp. TaxID=2024838 RepID=UPI0032F72DC5
MSIEDIVDQAWKKSFIPILRKKSLDQLVEADNVLFSKKHNDFLKRNWASITPYTLIDPFRIGVLLDLLDQTLDLDGDIVECGAYKGGTGLLLAMLLRDLSIHKKIHLFDSFEGLPAPHLTKDMGYKVGEFRSDYEQLKSLIDAFGLNGYITIHKGWFKDTIPQYTSRENKICFLHIDCDLYQSTIDSFGNLIGYLDPKSIVVFDDFNDGSGGERQAVLDILRDNKKVFHLGPAPQTYYFSSPSHQNTSHRISDGNLTFDYSAIVENKGYLNWLSKVGKINFEQILKSFK